MGGPPFSLTLPEKRCRHLLLTANYMCGICGIMTFGHHPHPPDETVLRMRDALAHRGPDAVGIASWPHITLAHRRLSVIDVAGSPQPMFNERGNVCIIYNGEVYNFVELRQTLESKGHRFKTGGDTEVLVQLYEEYGSECVTKLRGMFAFAIWDDAHRRLFLARDHLGVKPLYYFADPTRFVFASEIKAIHEDPYCRKRRAIDYEALNAYFADLCVPAPLTIFKGIRKLPPGHWMQVSSEGQVTIQPYWSVRFGAEPVSTSEDALGEELRMRLGESVRMMMVSDVPLGAFLSGGLDSSTVVALMAMQSDRAIKTFSIGFAEEKYDESSDARLVATHFATEHTEVVLSHQDMLNEAMALIVHFDEPFADSSLLPTFIVSKMARQHVTVALSGDGGDELFGGYPWRHCRPRFQLRCAALPLRLRRLIRRLAGCLPARFPNQYYLSRLDLPYERFLLEARGSYDSALRSSLFSDDLQRELEGIDVHSLALRHLSEAPERNWVDRLMELDLKTYLPDELLVKVDRMSMRASLEVRVPLLDHHFVEFASRVPAELKYHGNEWKYLLRKSMRGILPDRILQKPKQGFSVPLATWLRTGLRDVLCDALRGECGGGLFERVAVNRLLDEFLWGDDRHAERLWQLLVFETWRFSHLS